MPLGPSGCILRASLVGDAHKYVVSLSNKCAACYVVGSWSFAGKKVDLAPQTRHTTVHPECRNYIVRCEQAKLLPTKKKAPDESDASWPLRLYLASIVGG